MDLNFNHRDGNKVVVVVEVVVVVVSVFVCSLSGAILDWRPGRSIQVEGCWHVTQDPTATRAPAASL